MERRVHTYPALSDSEELSETTAPNSPSWDDIKVEAPSPKKRKTVQKKLVSVPIGEVEGSKSKSTDTYPPSDSWAWRKYGQKSIKDSPYPRGYYRCSSAKGCPAKKQVERSRADPTMLIITYACDHNHQPSNKSDASTSPPSPPSTPTISNSGNSSLGGAAASANESSSSMFHCEDLMVFRESPKFELPSSDSAGGLLDQEFGWFNEIASACVLESPICSVEDDVAWITMEEDDALFADLGELPECSSVFRRSSLILSARAIACGGNARELVVNLE